MMKHKTVGLLCLCVLLIGMLSIPAAADSPKFQFEFETPATALVEHEATTASFTVQAQILPLENNVSMNWLRLFVAPTASQTGEAVLTAEAPDLSGTEGYRTSFTVTVPVEWLGSELSIFASYEQVVYHDPPTVQPENTQETADPEDPENTGEPEETEAPDPTAEPTAPPPDITSVEKQLVKTFTVAWEDAPYSAIRFTVTPSEKVLPQGKKVTFIYQIENIGNRDLTDLNVSAGIRYEISGTQGISAGVKSRSRLSCREGENTWTYSYTVTMNETVLVKPTIQYTDHNGVLQEKTLDEQQVLLQDIGVEFNLVARPKPSAPYGGEISLIYTVQNMGNVPLQNIVILDELGAPVNDKKETIQPGGTITGVISVLVTGDKTYRYNLTALNPQGIEYTAVSNGVNVTLEASGNELMLTVQASADRTALTYPDQVTFDISVINGPDSAVSDIQLVDHTGAIVATIARLEPGQERIYSWKREMSLSEDVTFRAIVVDANGNNRVFEAEPIHISVEGTTPAPTETPSAAITPEPTEEQQPTADATATHAPGNNDSTLVTILFLILGVIVAAIIALVIISLVQKKNARRKNVMHRRIKK